MNKFPFCLLLFNANVDFEASPCEHRQVVVESASVPRSRGGSLSGGWELRMEEVPDVMGPFEAGVPDVTW